MSPYNNVFRYYVKFSPGLQDVGSYTPITKQSSPATQNVEAELHKFPQFKCSRHNEKENLVHQVAQTPFFDGLKNRGFWHIKMSSLHAQHGFKHALDVKVVLVWALMEVWRKSIVKKVYDPT